MNILKEIAPIVLIVSGSISCNSGGTGAVQIQVDDTLQSHTSDTLLGDLPVEKDTTRWPAEGVPNFEVDDYPLTYQMISAEARSRVSGEIVDPEGAWFSNDTIGQSLVFLLYTDGHRMVTYHFLNKDIPAGIIDRMELNVNEDGIGGDLASYAQKKKYFKGFLTQSKKIPRSFFTSYKGFKLNDNKEKALKIYGKPDSITVDNGVEKYEWDFIGDAFYEKTMDRKGKPLAKDNFGHQVIMFFRNNRLIGLILHNDIP